MPTPRASRLGASVWTRDVGRGRAVGDAIEAGSVWLNDHAYSYGMGQAPWGGSRALRLRAHARRGTGSESMSHVTYRDSDPGRLAPPWWYPYSEQVADGFAGALGVLYGDGPRARAGALWRHRRGLVELGSRVLRR